MSPKRITDDQNTPSTELPSMRLIPRIAGGPIRPDQLHQLDGLRALTLADAMRLRIAHPDSLKDDHEQRRARFLIREFPQLCERKLYEINSLDILHFRDARAEKHECGNATINKDLSSISGAFKFMRKFVHALDLENPVLEDHRLPEGKFEIVRLTPAVEAHFMSFAQLYELKNTVPLATIFQLLVLTAMRRSELAGLDWRDVNLSDNTIYLATSKNGESRMIPLWPEAVTLFRSLNPKTFGPIFPSADTISTAWFRVRESAVNAALATGDEWLARMTKRLRIHDLRHEGITQFVERTDWQDVKIMGIVGHKQHATFKRYTHFRVQNYARELHSIELGFPMASNDIVVKASVPKVSKETKSKLAWDHVRRNKVALQAMTASMPMTRIAEMFLISEAAVRKAVSKANVTTPPRGYWLSANAQ